MRKNVKKLLILNIPYLVLELLFTKLPEAWRYTNGADLGEKILSLGEGFSKAFFYGERHNTKTGLLPLCKIQKQYRRLHHSLYP